MTSQSNYNTVLSTTIQKTPVSELYFSDENIKRIQKMIKNDVLLKTNNKYKLTVDQDKTDLLINMRSVYLQYALNSHCNPVHQVKKLNKQTVDYVSTDLISNIKQYYGYIKDISTPMIPMSLPINDNNAGRKLLPSITTTWIR